MTSWPDGRKRNHSQYDMPWLTEETDLDIQLLKAKQVFLSSGCIPFEELKHLEPGDRVTMLYIMDSGVNPSLRRRFAFEVGKQTIENGEHVHLDLVIHQCDGSRMQFVFRKNIDSTPFAAALSNYRKSWRLFRA